MSTWDMDGKILTFGTSDAAARSMVWMLELKIGLVKEGVVKECGIEKSPARLVIYASGVLAAGDSNSYAHGARAWSHFSAKSESWVATMLAFKLGEYI